MHNDNIHKISGVMSEHRRVPIISKDKTLVGVLTQTDIINAVLNGHAPQTRIDSLVGKNTVSCSITSSIGDAVRIMKRYNVGGMPIVSGKKLVGMVNERDCLQLARFEEYPTVHDVMTKKPFFTSPHMTVFDCAKSMINTHYRRFPVVQDKRLVGIVTSHDILDHLRIWNFNIGSMSELVSNIMKTSVYTLSEENSIRDAVKLFARSAFGGAPVVKEGRLIGIITERDIVNLIRLGQSAFV